MEYSPLAIRVISSIFYKQNEYNAMLYVSCASIYNG